MISEQASRKFNHLENDRNADQSANESRLDAASSIPILRL